MIYGRGQPVCKRGSCQCYETQKLLHKYVRKKKMTERGVSPWRCRSVNLVHLPVTNAVSGVSGCSLLTGKACTLIRLQNPAMLWSLQIGFIYLCNVSRKACRKFSSILTTAVDGAKKTINIKVYYMPKMTLYQ